MQYSDKVIEHFMCPQNAYLMPDADAEGSAGDPSCGDALTFYIKVKDNYIQEISYLVFGCSASIATSSMTSVLTKGKSLDEALKITEEDIIEALDGLPESKVHCSNLGVSALRKAIDNYLKINGTQDAMLIAIPVTGQNLAANVCRLFGLAPYLLIYNLETKGSIFIKNSAAASYTGAGIKAAQTVADKKINALLTPECGENSARVLNAAGIKIYKTRSASVVDNINAFAEGQLSLLEKCNPDRIVERNK